MSKKISELPTAPSLNSADLVPIVQAGTTKSSTISLLVSSLGAVASVAWTNITGKPATFAPSAHVHPESEVTNLVTDLAAKATTASLTTHASNLANPHAVTKSQVGLGSADNTSDLAKPISTAQQTALDAKVAGPASATNDRVALFSGATGKLIKEATQTIANLLARANHTGQQTMATISDAGGAATLNVGTTAGTVASGDDFRIGGAAQKSANGSDFTNPTAFRANMDLEGGIDWQAWREELDKYGIKGINVSSSSVIDLGAATGAVIDITGTTPITALGTAIAGTIRFVRFTGILVLTHNATSLILPGGLNITTKANACAVFLSLGSGNWWCAVYQDVVFTAPTGAVVGTTDAQTLTSKTLTSAILNGTLDIAQAVKFTGAITPPQITTNQNDYAPANFATATVIRISADADRSITGLAGGVDGLTKIFHNVGAFVITFADEDAASLAANRFAAAGAVAGHRPMHPDSTASFIYDGTSSRWRVEGGSPNFLVDKTITPSGTNGAQTINKAAGSVNFAAAATSLVVTNSLVTVNSVIIATVATNDSTMKSALAVAAAGSFTLFPNANPTAATRVNWIVVN